MLLILVFLRQLCSTTPLRKAMPNRSSRFLLPIRPAETTAYLGCADSVTAPLNESAGFLQRCVRTKLMHGKDGEAKALACAVMQKHVTAQASNLHCLCVPLLCVSARHADVACQSSDA